MGKKDWVRTPDGHIRQYSNYDAYVKHQGDKLALSLLVTKAAFRKYSKVYKPALAERVRQDKAINAGMSALCLGARLGPEVEVFMDCGCFAVGIDLNPGPNNKFVLYGDFHKIQYADSSVDIVFTNSLDHALYINKVVSEVKRILKPSGLLIVEATRGSSEVPKAKAWESYRWKSIDTLFRIFEDTGFKLLKRYAFREPWKGDHACFKLSGGGAQ